MSRSNSWRLLATLLNFDPQLLAAGPQPLAGGKTSNKVSNKPRKSQPLAGGAARSRATSCGAARSPAASCPARKCCVAAAEQAPGPAVGRQMQVWVPQWDPDWSHEEITHLRTLLAWNDLHKWVRQNLRVSAPKTLAAHTTTACQPGKVPGPSGPDGILKTCGLETFLQVPAGGGSSLSYVQIILPHAFVHGDGLEIRFVSLASVELDTHIKIQEHACRVVVLLGGVRAPARVQLHPWCFHGGTQAIEEFQKKAVDFGQSVGFCGHSLAWQVLEIHAAQLLAAAALGCQVLLIVLQAISRMASRRNSRSSCQSTVCCHS